MSSYLGKNLHVSIFGQSHAPAIGVTVDGLPAGERVDLEELDRFLQRRAPGRDATATPRTGTPAARRWRRSSRTPTPGPGTMRI